ncbi:MAG: adenylate kinase family protein [Candidatus Parvarchaeota archaeon]|nr:adenylate kinase family protein [Candidatus Jingweiarchaeum tengchongense]MCW1298380.1 adenylate kinase family protein [Candidatus Jingweiarchaeum tengchongense]MCW1300318.1 adenylate kinase family protein [Candidatus Jingweiarchaeum tengchongense]MCW1304885.1 adenylate kinase family protein [Candidatus Jingweiarchaeum tengchongense]MCW1305814.1 adenylate kinase family protein [Candidatus Jingweiarchaeum tengchongense]
MKKAILISGTPGTGKTRIAKVLAKRLDAIVVGIDDVIKIDKKVVIGYDKKRKIKIVDEERFAQDIESIIKKIDKQVIVDSHFAHVAKPKFCEICIVLRCNPRELKRRLESKGYKKEKIIENVEAEIVGVCTYEALKNGHKVHEIDTSKRKIDEVVKEIIDVIEKRKKASCSVCWGEESFK